MQYEENIILLDIFAWIARQTFQVFETWKVYASPKFKMSSSMGKYNYFPYLHLDVGNCTSVFLP